LAQSNSVSAADIRERPRDFVVRVDFFELHQLIDLQPPPGSVYVRSVVEPFDDEMAFDQRRIDNWLRVFGLWPFHQIHASGHANGRDLVEMIRTIQPKLVVPIHTEHAELFAHHLSRVGIPVTRPQNVLAGGAALEL
ncbi:MAG TPA: MBL fold metallo-hydrolase RNA specificity domain-containing protein, partial [Burkholderiales bacterium]|nr:MBL fold metallo-hydrolase RNA specificity domain-containing protein [Burkholderiales bacterium]